MSGQLKHPERVRWNLKIAIIEKYGSQTVFARILGISRQQLTHIIVGRNPGWHIRGKASELLGRSEEFLFSPDGADLRPSGQGGNGGKDN